MTTSPAAVAAADLKALFAQTEQSAQFTGDAITATHHILDAYTDEGAPKRVAAAGAKVLMLAAARLTRTLWPEVQQVNMHPFAHDANALASIFGDDEDDDGVVTGVTFILKSRGVYLDSVFRDADTKVPESLVEPMLREVLLHPALDEFWIWREGNSLGKCGALFFDVLLITDERRSTCAGHDGYLTELATSLATS